MSRFAVLLRGVNVGGHRKVPMATLRQAIEDAGYTDVATYLQSGNAVLTGPDDDPDAVARRVHDGLLRTLDMDIDVLARTGPELAAVVAGNPFPEVAADPKNLHVAFLSGQPDPAVVAALDRDGWAPEAFAFGDRAVYLRYVNHSRDSKLAQGVLGPLKLIVTARNWNTVVALADKTSG